MRSSLWSHVERNNVEADVADASWFRDVVLDDGEHLGRTLRAEQTTTVSAAEVRTKFLPFVYLEVFCIYVHYFN